MANHVLILGCGRSGTSIFGELFEHLPQYTYLSEPPLTEVVSHNFDKLVAIKVPKNNEEFPATIGLSFPLDLMKATMPAQTAWFWQVRHPLDAIASLKVGICNNWGHHPRPTDWRSWLDRSLIEQCAHHWAWINTHGFAAVRDIVTVGRFEHMICDPHSFAKSICANAGIDWDENATCITDWCDRVQDTNNEQFVEAKTSRRYSRPDHSRRVGRWRENLSEEEVERVVPIVRPAADHFGYELPN